MERMSAADLLARTAKRKRGDVEGPIHKAILDYLILVLPIGTPIHHSPNEMNLAGDPRSKAIAQARAKAMGMRPGWPDFEFILGGAFYAIEVKSRDGKQTREQAQVEADIRAAGGRYGVVRSVDGARKLLQSWGVVK
jgi:hypothetical protein